ncbi:TPA: pyocin knob domain-containing protein, partial [Aeromonas hydrophila]
ATGSVSLDGSENVSLAVTVPPTAHTHTPAQVGLGNVPNWPATAAVNDASDAKFATAGAVKKAYDLAASKANAAHDHAGSIVTPITLGKEDLNTIVKPGVYAQHANANTSAAQHYPENQAGSLTVTIGAGIQQRYHVYNSTRVYIRAQYDKGAFSPWALQYTTTNRPSPTEIGAAPAAHGHSPAEVGLSNLVNKGWNYAAVADTYAVRDGQGDLHARLFRATFPDQGDFGGAIAFRYNNQGDSYTRYCNNPAAVRNWLGVSSHQRLAATQVGGSIPASDGAAINLYRDVRGYSGLTIVEQNGFTQYLYFQWPHADCVFQVQLGNDHGIFQLYNNGTALKRLRGWAEHSAWHSWWIMT